jgi:Ca2+-binding EF-hand superfamily protein
MYDGADKNHNHKIERDEFSNLIRGYFDMKAIQPLKENYDTYFERLDKNHDNAVSLEEFLVFMDEVVENDILPFITEEMQNRGLL